MNPIIRAIKSTPDRRTRLHDEQGRALDLASVTSIPQVFADAALHLAFKHRREVPWLSYRAVRQLARLIQPHWRILEFGAGGSTVWFARRGAFVMSIESSPEWYEQVRRSLIKLHASNVQLEFRPSTDCAAYANVEAPDDSFDLALIDGECRSQCVPLCLRKVKPGGYIYLDNTDRAGDPKLAEGRLLTAQLAWKRHYRDFAPGSPAIFEGLLVRRTD